MGRGAAVHALLLALCGATVPAPLPAEDRDASGCWVPAPSIPPPPSTITDFAMDARGRPWCLASGRVLRLEGNGWIEPPDGKGPLRGESFLGGPDRGLFLIQRGSDDLGGALLPLDVEPPASPRPFYRESRSTPSLFVSRDGTLFNHGSRYLAVWRNGAWDGGEVPLGSPGRLAAVESGPGGTVLFLPQGGEPGAWWDGTALRHPLLFPDPAKAGTPSRRSLSFCALGRERVLRLEHPGADILAFDPAAGTLAVDVEATDRLAGRWSGITAVMGASPAPGGGAWVVIRGHAGFGDRLSLHHISAGGELRRIPLPGGARPSVAESRGNLRSIVMGADAAAGTEWLADEGGGLIRLRDGRAEAFGPDRGASPASIRWIAGREGVPPLAATAEGLLLRWDPEAKPPEDFIQRWGEWPLLAVPLAAPDGSLWMTLEDRPDSILRWDGAAWSEPVTGQVLRLGSSLVTLDDRGAILLQGWEGARYTILRDGATSGFGTMEEALLALRAGGAVRYAHGDQPWLVLPTGGRGWFLESGSRHLRVFGDGAPGPVAVSGITCLDSGDSTVSPLFGSRERWYSWQEGRLLARPVSGGTRPEVRMIRPLRDYLPFDPGLSREFRDRTLLLSMEAPCRPVLWEEAVRAFAAGETPRSTPVRDLGLPPRSSPGTERAPASLENIAVAFPDGDGGFWLLDGRGRLLRLRGDAAFAPDLSGTPLSGVLLERILPDPSGRAWFLCKRGDAFTAWFHRAGGPVLGKPEIEVIRGRRILFRSGDGGVAFVERRVSPLGPWRLDRNDGSSSWDASGPGARRMVFDLRGYDLLGVAGPSVRVAANVDPRFPEIAWSGGTAPLAVNEPRWKVPLEVVWAFPSVLHRIEMRLDGGAWRELDGDGTVLVAPFNNRAIAVEFRALEEEAFASGILSATVAVEMDLEPWIRRRITGALRGDAAALADLASVRDAAIRILEPMEEPGCARLIERLRRGR